MGDNRTQQEKQHDKVSPGSGSGRQQDAQKQGAPGVPKR